MRWSVGIIIAGLAAGCGGGDRGPAGQGAYPAEAAFAQRTLAAAEQITEAAIRPVVAELSSDRYAGRAPGSAGDVAARDYLAAQLEAAGFRPAMADGSWQQAFSLIGVNTAQPPSWTFVRAGQRLVLDQGSDFIVSNGTQTARAAIVDAEVVFVGYGIQAPEYGWDDFKGADVAGKVLLMLNNDPDWDPALFEGATRLYYGRWSYKYEIAARLGAAGAIIIHTPPSAGYPWQVVRTSWSGTQFHLPAGDRDALAIAAWISEQAARELLSLADLDFEALGAAARSRDFAPVSLGLRTSIALDSALSEVATANVLGLLDGSDPDLADEAVVFMAHHDHLGVAVPDSQRGPDQDLIYNGARDNASGVGIVTAIAHAVGALSTPPRRSVLVAYVGAEEQGLLGSEYFARHPVIPAGKIAAAVNFDSANIWGRTSDISFIGLGKSDLDEVARAVGGFQDREVTADRFPDRGYYYRSDQFSLAKIGIPAMYLKSGIEFLDRPAGWGTEQIEAYEREHYHQPSDELTAAWDFSGLVDDARFGYLAGILVANEEHFPAWRAGDEFEAARREAVDAAR